jgi:hypothetical protein
MTYEVTISPNKNNEKVDPSSVPKGTAATASTSLKNLLAGTQYILTIMTKSGTQLSDAVSKTFSTSKLNFMTGDPPASRTFIIMLI